MIVSHMYYQMPINSDIKYNKKYSLWTIFVTSPV